MKNEDGVEVEIDQLQSPGVSSGNGIGESVTTADPRPLVHQHVWVRQVYSQNSACARRVAA